MSPTDPARRADEEAAAREAVRRRLVPEVETALRAGEQARARAWPPDWRKTGTVAYFYRSSRLLVRDRDLSRVEGVLDDLGARAPDEEVVADRSRSLVSGLTCVPTTVRESQHTPDVVDDLDKRLGVGVATHDHAFVVVYVTVCPASEPEAVLTPTWAEDPVRVQEALWPPIADAAAGSDVRVAVVDTGLIDGAQAWAPWLTDVRPNGPHDLEDPDQIKVDGQDRGRDGYADPYAGHGTFVAGVVKCVAPAAEVTVERVIEPSGFVFESSLTKQLEDALSRSPDVITMSAGGFTRNNLPPLAFQRLYEERLSQLGGVVLIAAAGNDGSTTPFWPAAFPWCVGVGSTSKDGQRRSWFSNHGSWVDVYAPGEEIVNAYARLPYLPVEGGDVRRTEAGIVRWSGTSFSTPIVAGLVAARMSRTGESGAQAARSLLTAARGQFRPGIGPRLFP